MTLTADPTSINKGDSVTLSWTSTNATQLTIAPEVGAVAPEGSTKVTPSDSVDLYHHGQRPGRLRGFQRAHHRRRARRAAAACDATLPSTRCS